MIEHAQHQPNAWACGPAALRNAMLVHEHKTDVRHLLRGSRTKCCHKSKDRRTWDRDGTCEHGLRQVAEAEGFRLEHLYALSVTELYETLRQNLPALLAVDADTHWVTAVRATARHVWIIDPARDEELHQRLTWRQLAIRLAHWSPEIVAFHFYPVVVML